MPNKWQKADKPTKRKNPEQRLPPSTEGWLLELNLWDHSLTSNVQNVARTVFMNRSLPKFNQPIFKPIFYEI